MDEVRAGVVRRFDALQRRWPAELQLYPERPPEFWGELALHLSPVFPPPPDPVAVATFGLLYAELAIAWDHLLDGRGSDAVALRATALDAEAQRWLRRVFPPDAPFWDQHDRALSEHARAAVLERSFRCGRPLAEYDVPTALAAAAAKTCLARVVVAALGHLSGAPEQIEPVCEAIARVGEAIGMRDDLVDWRDDLRARQPSLLLSRVLEAWPERVDAAVERDVGRALHLGGASREVLALALAALDRADAALAALPPTRFSDCTADMRAASQTQIARLAEAAAEVHVQLGPGVWHPPSDDPRRVIRPWSIAVG